MAGLKIGISGDGVGRLASAIAHLLFMAFDGFSINWALCAGLPP
jgi:hypothetical protein